MTKIFQNKIISFSTAGVIVAAILLANPIVGLVDILPDVLAWTAAWYALRLFAECNENMTRARRMALYLLGISALKILLQQTVGGSDIRSDSMLATFVFALVESGCMVLFFRSFLQGSEELARTNDCERMYLSIENVRFLSVLFVIARGACNFLPELTALPDWYVQYGEVLDDDMYNLMVQLAGAKQILNVICAVVALIVAVIWLVSFVPFVRSFAKEQALRAHFLDYLCTDSDEKRFKRSCSYLHMARLCIALGLLFVFDWAIEDLRVLPICVFPALMLCACLFLQKLAGVRCYRVPIVLAGASSVVLLLAELYRRYFTVWDARVYAEVQTDKQVILGAFAVVGMGLLLFFWLYFSMQTEQVSRSFGCGELHLGGTPYVLLVLLTLAWTAVYVLPPVSGTFNFARLALGAVLWVVANRRMAAWEENIRTRLSLGYGQKMEHFHEKIR